MFGLIGKKIGMTQVFDEDGLFIPVTVLEVSPNVVVQVKTENGKDGYNALKLATGEVRAKNRTRPEIGVFEAAGVPLKRTVREFRVDAAKTTEYKQGDSIDVSVFEVGTKVDVQATSKGRGFAGVVKRHGFKGAKEKTHGTQTYKRHGGSIGTGATPGRVIKNTKMPGQMGNVTVTTRGLKVVQVLPEDGLLVVSGSVPGAPGAIVKVAFQPEKKKKKS